MDHEIRIKNVYTYIFIHITYIIGGFNSRFALSNLINGFAMLHKLHERSRISMGSSETPRIKIKPGKIYSG